MEVTMNNNIAYITVRIEHQGDIEDIVSNCDYEFNHDDIIDTEIVGSDVMDIQ
jgi:hypothetical protein